VAVTSASIVIAVAAMGLLPREHFVKENVDLIEVNHYHDEHGRLIFDQVIFYDWSPIDGRYQVRDWRLLKSPSQVPRRNWRSGGYQVIWNDERTGDTLRQIDARSLRETWTNHDPEMRERAFLPQEKRRTLLKLHRGQQRRRR